jgi:hypothetical protein
VYRFAANDANAAVHAIVIFGAVLAPVIPVDCVCALVPDGSYKVAANV